MPGLRAFHMGAFITAATADLPVVPIVIRGTRSMLRGDDKFPHHGAISIQVGPVIRSADRPEAADGWSRALQLRNACRDYILRHCAEPDLDQA
jgi:1-acyl-sn-glycerol-3-phosphate acyltransferase